MVRRRIVRISLTLVHLACFRLSMGSLGSMMREPKYQNGAAENRTSNPPRKLSGGLAEPLSAFCETRRVDLVEPATFEGPSPAQRLAVRQERSAPLVTELERWMSRRATSSRAFGRRLRCENSEERANGRIILSGWFHHREDAKMRTLPPLTRSLVIVRQLSMPLDSQKLNG
ncbi:MAG: hypothetical protein E5Y32_20585 [Mesorhizobium sp.]|nr:MAG: hypothetical protein E5Y32_20585 [Mesorhizobium sp.]